MRIILHLGVHKTATTYLQSVLDANREQLRAAGAVYLPLNEVRTSITPRLRRPLMGLKSSVERILETQRDSDRLIISDENIIGMAREAVQHKAFYPDFRLRVSRLLKALSAHPTELFVATRSYERFISSMYTEYIRNSPFRTVDEFLEGVAIDDLNWHKIIGDLCDLVGPRNVTMWRFEDFAEIEGEVLSSLTGGIAMENFGHGGRVRQSPSQRAIDELVTMVGSRPRQEIRQFATDMAEESSQAGGHRAFQAFDPADAARLQARYERDLALLEEDFPAMRVIRSAAANMNHDAWRPIAPVQEQSG